jgi:hypothetical protein
MTHRRNSLFACDDAPDGSRRHFSGCILSDEACRMDTRNDPTPTTSPDYPLTLAEYDRQRDAADAANAARMPEWRRRSLAAAASPFSAVADMTDRVAGR